MWLIPEIKTFSQLKANTAYYGGLAGRNPHIIQPQDIRSMKRRTLNELLVSLYPVDYLLVGHVWILAKKKGPKMI